MAFIYSDNNYLLMKNEWKIIIKYTNKKYYMFIFEIIIN